MTPYEIRPATTDDARELSALIQETVRTSNARDYSAAIIESICASFARDEVIAKLKQRDVFVAASDGRMLETVSLGAGKLHSLFVAPKHQGEGLGRGLVAHLERNAIHKGLADLWLSSSITARSFYDRLGYALVRFDERPDGSTFLMRKSLMRPHCPNHEP